ncbi:MAG: CHASE3 domain-containing protein [Betaproteobacteria bacterium]
MSEVLQPELIPIRVRSEEGLSAQLGFVMALAIMVAISALAFSTVKSLVEQARWVEHTHRVIESLARVQWLMSEAESGHRDFVITRSEPLLGRYSKAMLDVEAEFASLRPLLIDNLEQKARLNSLRTLVIEQRLILESEIASLRHGNFDEVRRKIDSGTGKAVTDAIRQLTEEMSLSERAFLGTRLQKTEGAAVSAGAILVIGMAASVAMLVFAYLRLRREIAQRARAQKALNDANTFLDSVFENIPAMVFVKDAVTLRYLRLNRAGEDILGMPRDEVIGKSDRELFLPEEAAAFGAQDRRALAGDGVLDIEEERVVTPHRGIRTLHTKKLPIASSDGDARYELGIAEDITDRRRVQEEIRQLNESLARRAHELELSNRELEAFSYSVSHDLRAPLRAIDGFAMILAEDHAERLSDEGRRLLDVVRDNARRMGQLIDDLLAFSRIGRGPTEVVIIDMNAMMASVLQELAGEAAVRWTCSVQPLPDVLGEPALLRQVCFNLLSNAIKYSATRAAPRIQVRGEVVSGQCEFCVADNGVGFDMRYVDKLFTVFQRLHRADEFAGTGVGLAIVRRIVERHGGRAWAESEIGRGARFHFALPTGEQQ